MYLFFFYYYKTFLEDCFIYEGKRQSEIHLFLLYEVK